MKKIITLNAVVVFFTFFMMLTSCTTNPVDKLLDKMEATMDEANRIADEEHPSPEEYVYFQKNADEIHQLFMQLQNGRSADNQFTDKQKERFRALNKRMQHMAWDPKYRRLANMARQYKMDR